MTALHQSAVEERTAPTPSSEAPPVVLRAEGLEVRYGKQRHPVVSCEELTLHAGERVAMIGRSGCGKTSLLRALEGSVAATGTIERSGKVALVYQDLRLVPERSVLDNVCAGALGCESGIACAFRFPERIKRRARSLLAELGLAKLSHVRAGALSGGQRQRVAIARALCSQPTVVLADEPTSSLDPANARRVLALLAQLQEKYGFALVVSSHSLPATAFTFDRILAVRGGVTAPIDPEKEAAPAAGVVDSAVACPVTRAVEELQREPAGDEQDHHGGERSALVKAAWFGLAILAAGALVAWSAAALNVDRQSFTGAIGGMAEFSRSIFPASWAEWREMPWGTLGASLLVTIQMAILGTGIGIALSAPLAILASRVTGPRFVRWPMRQVLNLVRTIPSIIWALIFVAAVGLGPVAGVLALAMYSVGYLTKFFYEGLENTDDRPAKALEALGASRFQSFLHAMLPGARPSLLASCLFVLEYNIRAASVLGVVGAGGIGQDLMYYIEWRDFPPAAAGLAMILVIVIALDSISEVWRRRLARQRGI